MKTSKITNIILWILQTLLSMTFIWAGAMKLFQAQELPWIWIKENPTLVSLTGILDLLAGIGIILPTILNFKPSLTVLTAYGIIILMLAAIVFHISRGEASDIGFNIFMLFAALFIAWGRAK